LRRSEVERLSIDEDPAPADRVGAEDGAGELGPAGADEAGEPDDLALGDGERYVEKPRRRGVARVALGGEAFHPKRRLARAMRTPALEQPIDLAPDHHADDVVDLDLGDRRRAHEPAVAKHRDAVGERLHLVQPVADEDDADALITKIAADAEEPRHLVLGKRRGRLVHHDQPGRDGKRLGDLDHLLLGDREVGHEPVGVEVETDPGNDGPGLAPHPWPVDDAPIAHAKAKRLAADEDVLGHGQGRDQVELLIDRDDAAALRLERARKRHGPPSIAIVPASGGWAPARIFNNVDLPAPFSPRSAWISPCRTSKTTPSTAFTPGKDFTMPDMRMSGGAPLPLGMVAADPDTVLSVMSAGLGRALDVSSARRAVPRPRYCRR
jgi:hypothetical protein